MATQFGVVAIGALVLAPCAIFGEPWLATPIFLVLAMISSFGYLRMLGSVDRMVQSRMDSLTLEIMKTT
jgi:hypothetical protein